MRTFRFITVGSSATEAQEQTISCNLHLDPVNEVTSTQPENCSCYTEDDCLNQGTVVTNLSNNQDKRFLDALCILDALLTSSMVLFKFRCPDHI